MNFWVGFLNFLQTTMTRPTVFGWYHILWLGITVGLTVLLCTRFRNCSRETVRKVVFGVAVLVALLEIYKQIVFTFSVADGAIVADFQWYAFPWQFCSTPMYVGLLVGVFRKGKVHDALCAYLATYSMFAGLCVMIYPGDVFIETIGVNIQTMICHGSMIVIGAWLLATGYVPMVNRTIGKAACVFASTIAVAIVLNEVTWYTDLTGGETFNMFYISRHWEGTLPVYSQVQKILAYPWCLIVYIAAFTVAAYIMLLAAMGIRHLAQSKGARMGKTQKASVA